MKIMNKNFVILAVILQVMSLASLLLANQEFGAKPLTSEVIQKTQELQIPFIANKGQTDERVAYYANTFGGTVFITKDGEIVYSLPKKSSELGVQSFELLEGIKDKKQDISGTNTLFIRNSTYLLPLITNLTRTWNLNSPFVKEELNNQGSSLLVQSCTLDQNISVKSGRPSLCETLNNPHSANQNPQLIGLVLKEEFVGGKINTIQGEAPSITKVNYFRGNDPSKWKTNISTYEVVDIGEIYKGINLKLKAYGSNVEKLFYVEPDANPDQIKVKLNGAKRLRINKEWQLEVKTELGTVKFTKPVAYQEIDGKRVEVAARYTLITSKSETRNSKLNPPGSELTYGFEVASYDKTKELIIDPLLASTFLGGSNSERGESLALDSGGNLYITGFVNSSNFPITTGAYDTSHYSTDCFVSKISSDLTSVIASTFLGGSSRDYGNSITIDSNENIYVGGDTFSADFPTTSGAYDSTYNGDEDAFVSELSSDLSSLIASTILGASVIDEVISIVTDFSGVFVAGRTNSPDFPTTLGAYDAFHNGNDDAFVLKFSSDLTNLIASTFLGGLDNDWGYSHAIDPYGNVYVAGYTRSQNFPTTAGAYDTSHNADYDAFVASLSNDLASLIASTYLGGSLAEYCYSLTLDADGNVYVTGNTVSSNFPITQGAYDNSHNGSNDAFVSKLNSDLTSLDASTFLGGSLQDYSYSIDTDSGGNAYVTGRTSSSNFSTIPGAFDTSYNGGSDVIVSKFDGMLTSLIASTFLGGTVNDYGRAIIINSSDNVYVTGRTYSSDFPTTPGAFDTSFNSAANATDDVYISEFDSNLSGPPDTTPPTISSTNPASDAVNVDINSVVTATFDEPMNPDTIIIGNTFTVSGITGTVTYDPATMTATFTPSSPLTYSAAYTATITIDAQDTAGNAMASNYSWSFTTSAGPTQQAIYAFDEGSGQTATDSSGNGNDGTIIGATWTTGKNGGALSFNGINNYVSIPRMNNEEVSMCAWFYKNINDTAAIDGILEGYRWNSNIQLREGFDIRFNQGAPNTLRFILVTQDGSGNRTERTATRNLINSINSWYHVAGTYNKTTGKQKLYVNGQLVNTQSHPAGNTVVPLTTYSDMRIGFSRSNGYFNGIIDDVRIYNRALSNKEVLDMFTAFNTGLQALYAFDEGSGTIATDSSGNGNHGTISGASWTTGHNGGGLNFDGTSNYVSIPRMNYEEVSMCAWFYKNINDTAAIDGIWGGYRWNSNIQLREGFDIRFNQGAPNTLRFILVTQDGSGNRTERTATMNLINSISSWYHVAGTYNKTTGEQKLYVNGQLVNTQTHPAGNTVVPLTTYSDMRIGFSRSNGYFNGVTDDVRLYNRVLSDLEVLDLYTQ